MFYTKYFNKFIYDFDQKSCSVCYFLINFGGLLMDIKQLKSRHKELNKIIELSFKNYVPDLKIRKFKKEKLRIKEMLDKNYI